MKNYENKQIKKKFKTSHLVHNPFKEKVFKLKFI